MFSERFSFSLPARVNLVGGGGKTALILALLEEYSQKLPVIYTTTTRIHPPHPAQGMIIISSDNEQWLELLLERSLFGACHGRTFVVTRLPGAPNLLRGVDPGFGSRLDKLLFPVILNEADGARSMSIKMPREGEPVLMTGANYLVPVIGIDCLNQRLGPETVFRWDLAAERCQLEAGGILTPELAASLLFHPQGVCRAWQADMKIVPFINKVDSDETDDLARRLATALLHNGRFPVQRVVWGSLKTLRNGSFEM